MNFSGYVPLPNASGFDPNLKHAPKTFANSDIAPQRESANKKRAVDNNYGLPDARYGDECFPPKLVTSQEEENKERDSAERSRGRARSSCGNKATMLIVSSFQECKLWRSICRFLDEKGESRYSSRNYTRTPILKSYPVN